MFQNGKIIHKFTSRVEVSGLEVFLVGDFLGGRIFRWHNLFLEHKTVTIGITSLSMHLIYKKLQKIKPKNVNVLLVVVKLWKC